MTNYLTTSPLSILWTTPDASREQKGMRYTIGHYTIGMVSFAFSLPIRVAILAFRVLKAIAAIFYAIFGTLSQDRAKNWKECGNELVRLGGSIGELLSGCLGVLAPPLAYRAELELYANAAIREGAIFTVREERIGGVEFQPSAIRPTPEEPPLTLPDDHKPYVRPTNQPVSASPSNNVDLGAVGARADEMIHLVTQIMTGAEGQNQAEFTERFLEYMATRIADGTGDPSISRLVRDRAEIVSNPTPQAFVTAIQGLMEGGGQQGQGGLQGLFGRYFSYFQNLVAGTPPPPPIDNPLQDPPPRLDDPPVD